MNSQSKAEENRRILINIFRKEVKGKEPDVSNKNQKHDGKYGHWLEEQFKIHANGDNTADILGYELKSQTKEKTTFGDWSANEYIYNSEKYKTIFNKNKKIDNRNIFLEIFGKENIEKKGRYSWSGESCPKISKYNSFGQKLVIDEINKDIIVIYNYTEDHRKEKANIIPKEFQKDNLELARWYGNKLPSNKVINKREKCLKRKVEDKFNQFGWFTCKMDTTGRYNKICFGKPLTYDEWITMVKKGIVYFDSGMYNQNERPYSNWRADNSLWNKLIEYEYE